jgi:hypothetical protein
MEVRRKGDKGTKEIKEGENSGENCLILKEREK